MTCGTSSLFTQVTVLFAGTVRVSGPKLKLSTLTSVGDALASSLRARVGCRIKTATRPSGSANTKRLKNSFFLIIAFSSLRCNKSERTYPLLEGRVHDSQCLLPLYVIDISDAKNAAQLFGWNLHRPRALSLSGRGLGEGRGKCGVESHIAFDFLHGLVNVPVQDGN